MSEIIIEPILPNGTKLHDYEIQKVLGIGGFGITYLAKHRKLGSPVAIKEYMPQDFSVRTKSLQVRSVTSCNWNEESDWHDLFEFGLARFLTEAKDLVRFNHPNIVRVLNYFEANGTGYIVMDYVEGQTLKRWLASKKELPDENELKAIFLPVLDGLGHVHRNGLLHRDIKPGNIYLTTNGTPLLLDFGTAKDLVNRGSQTVHVFVTPGYSPKEQYVPGSNQGPFTDIYSVGGTMYCCLGGKPPAAAMDRADAVVSGNSDPQPKAAVEFSGNYSQYFLDTIDRCLAFNAAERPQSVADVVAGLRGEEVTLLAESTRSDPRTRKAPPRSRGRVASSERENAAPYSSENSNPEFDNENQDEIVPLQDMSVYSSVQNMSSRPDDSHTDKVNRWLQEECEDDILISETVLDDDVHVRSVSVSRKESSIWLSSRKMAWLLGIVCLFICLVMVYLYIGSRISDTLSLAPNDFSKDSNEPVDQAESPNQAVLSGDWYVELSEEGGPLNYVGLNTAQQFTSRLPSADDCIAFADAFNSKPGLVQQFIVLGFPVTSFWVDTNTGGIGICKVTQNSSNFFRSRVSSLSPSRADKAILARRI